MKAVKNIFIVRHGHAEYTAHTDFKRELTVKGKTAVLKTAQFIKCASQNLELSFDVCICSASARTKQTSEIICTENNIKEVIECKHLYATVASKWLDEVINCHHQNIVLVGHNPTFSQMIHVFCGKDIYMKPANCAFITLEIEADGIIYPAQLNQFYANELSKHS